jgi:ATP-dependent exoDNAse (exonuclease V) beta subunit
VSHEHAQLSLGDASPLDGRPEADERASGAVNGDTPPVTREQAEAVAIRDRDVFLEAGAGTGKTGVLVRRYCDAVTEDGVGVERILAFTFTEKAAGEVRDRIRAELGRRAAAAKAAGDPERALELSRQARDSERAWITTIHGFCRRLLAAHPAAAGLDPRFRVLDEPEAGRLGELAFAEALEELSARGDGEAEAIAAGFRVPRLRALIRSAHEKLRTQGAAHPSLPALPDPRAAGDESELSPEQAEEARAGYECMRALLAAYDAHYERLKHERSGLDFEDLQLRAVGLLDEQPAVAAIWRDRFTHMMVDEFQDTNPLQLALIERLRGSDTRQFTVGDERQSIYGFRFADLEVFRTERARSAASPDQRVVLPLSGNFRSHPEVLAAINVIGTALFGDDFQRLAVGSQPVIEPPGPTPLVELLLTAESGWDADEIDLAVPQEEGSAARVAEARGLASRLRELADDGVPRSEMVVLLRAFTHVHTYEEALERAGLAPYVVGGRGYWSHQQVEDVLRLLGTVANPLDDETLFGALASPAGGVSPDVLWILRRMAGEKRHIWPALESLIEDRVPEEGEALEWASRIPEEDVRRLRGFHETLSAVRREAPLLSLEALIGRVSDAFGYDLAVLMRPRGRQRLANVRKLMRLAREFEAHDGRDLAGFLSYAESRTGREDHEAQAATEAEDHDGVRVMTVHAAKGLEFGVVAVAELRRTLLAAPGGTDIRLGQQDGAGNGRNGAASLRVGIRLPRAGRESLTLWDYDELHGEAAEAEAQEECRLTYVAATRARDRLILSGGFRDGDLEPCEPAPSDPILRRILPALGLSGADDEVITVPAPPPRPGLDAGFPKGKIAVRITRPRPETAASLTRRGRRPGGATENAGTGPPPLLDRTLVEAPAGPGHLSYSALSEYSRCGYRFYVTRVLGLAEVDPQPDAPVINGDEVAGEADLGEDEIGVGTRERRYAFGASVHSMLEWSARNRWGVPGRERCRALLRGEGLAGSEQELEHAGSLVRAWLSSPLRGALDAPTVRAHPEAPFLLGLGGTVIRGKIDLLAELADGELLVVDYKTDALGDSDPAEHAGRYATQRAIYALAAPAIVGGEPRAVRTSYCFLERPERPVEHRFDDERLEAARNEVEELVAGVRGGRFDVTPEPHRALCFDCPARARLCSHEPSVTMAARGP